MPNNPKNTQDQKPGSLKQDPRKPSQKPDLDETQVPDRVNEPVAKDR